MNTTCFKVFLFIFGLLIGNRLVFGSGERLYMEKMCHTCHGVKGNRPMAPNWPKLCGQTKQYLQEQAIYIRDGKRATPMAASMKALVSTVTDEELMKIATYLEQACAIDEKP
ncbi:MAG: c-type cytochrome [Pseudobacteriovorax sp.]|nr:c-type cytochrome [Pseudobacteriovorax sp.]